MVKPSGGIESAAGGWRQTDANTPSAVSHERIEQCSSCCSTWLLPSLRWRWQGQTLTLQEVSRGPGKRIGVARGPNDPHIDFRYIVAFSAGGMAAEARKQNHPRIRLEKPHGNPHPSRPANLDCLAVRREERRRGSMCCLRWIERFGSTE